eukprot:gene8137-5671_t
MAVETPYSLGHPVKEPILYNKRLQLALYNPPYTHSLSLSRFYLTVNLNCPTEYCQDHNNNKQVREEYVRGRRDIIMRHLMDTNNPDQTK